MGLPASYLARTEAHLGAVGRGVRPPRGAEACEEAFGLSTGVHACVRGKKPLSPEMKWVLGATPFSPSLCFRATAWHLFALPMPLRSGIHDACEVHEDGKDDLSRHGLDHSSCDYGVKVLG